MKQLTEIRNLILKKANKSLKDSADQLSEDELNARILQPFADIDIAYEIFQELDGVFSQRSNMWYGRTKKIFKGNIFSRCGIIYSGMTDEQVFMLNDYFDKVNDSVKQDLAILYYQTQSKMMDIPQQKRDIMSKLVVCQVMLLLAHDSLLLDLNTHFLEVFHAAKNIKNLYNEYYEEVMGKDAPKLHFEDKMFTDSLKILFRKILQVTTNGIE